MSDLLETIGQIGVAIEQNRTVKVLREVIGFIETQANLLEKDKANIRNFPVSIDVNAKIKTLFLIGEYIKDIIEMELKGS